MPTSVRWIELSDGDPGVRYDVDLEIMELAHAFRISPSELPAAPIPYLHVDAARRLSSAFTVGVVARAGEWDHRRSVPSSLAHFAVERVAVFDLQLEGETLPGTRRAGERDALALGARLRSLDLVITVDTMMAHFAGALGVPTWLLLPYESDWRWMCDRTDSPWYPSLRLFRQPEPDDWTSVIAEVRNELREIVACAR